MNKIYMSLALLVVVPATSFTAPNVSVPSVVQAQAAKADEVKNQPAGVHGLGVVNKVKTLKNSVSCFVSKNPVKAVALVVATVVAAVVATKKKAEVEQELPF